MLFAQALDGIPLVYHNPQSKNAFSNHRYVRSDDERLYPSLQVLHPSLPPLQGKSVRSLGCWKHHAQKRGEPVLWLDTRAALGKGSEPRRAPWCGLIVVA